MSDDITKLEYLVLDRPAMLAILGHCIVNPGFMRNCSKCLTPKHIEDNIVAALYEFVLLYNKDYSHAPSVAEIETFIFGKFSDPARVREYRSALMEAVELQVKNFRVEALSAKISGWLKVVIMRKALNDSAQLFNRNNYESASREIVRFVANVKAAEFDIDDRVDMSNMASVIDKVVVGRDKACTLGHPDFDELIMEGSKIRPGDPRYDETCISGMTKGSLLPGEITIVVGPSNTGKTSAMSTIAVSNMAMGKKVCYIGCEDPKDKMSLKFMQSFFQKRLTEINVAGANPAEFAKLQSDWMKISQDHLYYYEWIKPGKMYVEDVCDTIENAQEKAIAKDGKGFDLLIIDYPGLLMSREFKGKDQWAEKQYVYYQFRMLAKKHNFHSLAPIQTNREGFKANAAAEKLIEMGDVASGFGIMTDADNVITINRNPDDHTYYRIKFYVAKTRSGEAKRLFVSEARYDLGRTHGLNFGFAVFESAQLGDANDNEILAKRLQRRMTNDLIAAKVGMNQLAYTSAPPTDKFQAKAAPAAPPQPPRDLTIPTPEEIAKYAAIARGEPPKQ